MAVFKWLRKWRLKSNPSKSDVILFDGKATTPKVGYYHTNTIKESKVLGLTLDNKSKPLQPLFLGNGICLDHKFTMAVIHIQHT